MRRDAWSCVAHRFPEITRTAPAGGPSGERLSISGYEPASTLRRRDARRTVPAACNMSYLLARVLARPRRACVLGLYGQIAASVNRFVG